MDELPVSPLAPDAFPKLPDVAGLRLGTVEGKLTYRGRDDMLLAALDPGTTVAGVFTKSRMPGAPVDWCRRQIGRGRARALVVNAGNANVFTGRDGAETVRQTAAAVAGLVGCRANQIFVASTGVIGERLSNAAVLKALPRLAKRLKPDNWEPAANAIRTTDTFAKASGRVARIGDREVGIVGIAKGSGMIAPDMATMLSFVFTDAKLPADVLDACLRRANEASFNAITVDSDTSTSDTLLLFATGAAGRHAPIASAGDRALRDFKAKLAEVLGDLAEQVVCDGEGARKLIRITVTGAASARAARRIAMAVANSPLVKTAIAGEDANWGRIVMAVGKAGEKADRDALSIRIGGVLVAERGYAHAGYREAEVVPHMRGQEIEIEVDVGIGRGKATVLTCDLTHGYIDINADYRS
ncbi:MAG: bifunctional glutamate N-acetyltransferase/amino-acid acetyltransferase ArgJ [Alphaproteobacteria bacterium]|jgi:glutamate N-acetyltransferase/amino-acid N-acetyltransferase|nr:bifunctional glutamate N-acetyltransferase/amino-acid acetyltransferase ArgJ [Alphaproteobacteria bacterium]